VVSILLLVAAAAIPMFQGGLVDQLENAAQIVLADSQRARQLAIANNSKYKLVFSDARSYYLQHSGTNAALNTLPSWPYAQSSDPATRQTTILDKLPGLTDVDIVGAVQVVDATRQSINELEFTALGATSRAHPTEVWIAAGQGAARRYLSIVVNPVTGLAEVGAVQVQSPDFDTETSIPVGPVFGS
jgi:hypothetical protein